MDLKKIAESIAYHEEVLAQAATTAVQRVETTAQRIAADMQSALAVAKDLGHLSLGEVGTKATAIWTSQIELPVGMQGTKFGGVHLYLDVWPETEPALRRGPPGSTSRVDELRGVGNCVHPLAAAVSLRGLLLRAIDAQEER